MLAEWGGTQKSHIQGPMKGNEGMVCQFGPLQFELKQRFSKSAWSKGEKKKAATQEGVDAVYHAGFLNEGGGGEGKIGTGVSMNFEIKGRKILRKGFEGIKQGEMEVTVGEGGKPEAGGMGGIKGISYVVKSLR